jgi:hypothetical protein
VAVLVYLQFVVAMLHCEGVAVLKEFQDVE